MTKRKFHISSSTRPVITKLWRVVIYDKGKAPIRSQDPRTMWSLEVTWQIKIKIPPLLQGLWPPNVSGWWLMTKGNHAWCRMTLLSRVATWIPPVLQRLSPPNCVGCWKFQVRLFSFHDKILNAQKHEQKPTNKTKLS